MNNKHKTNKQKLIELDYGKPIKEVLEDLYRQHKTITNVRKILNQKHNLSRTQCYVWFKQYNIDIDPTIWKRPTKYQINENFFEVWSSEMAWVLGVLYADGNISYCQHRVVQLWSADIDLIKKVLLQFNSTHKIFIHNPNRTILQSKISYSIHIPRKKMYNDLVKLGMIENKSNFMEFPDIPNKYLNHFLRGYTDGDGCIKKNQATVFYACGSKHYLIQMKKLLDNYNFKTSSTIKRMTTNCKNLTEIQPYILWVFGEDYIQWLYKGSTPNTRMDRKYKIYKNKDTRVKTHFKIQNKILCGRNTKSVYSTTNYKNVTCGCCKNTKIYKKKNM